MVRLPVRELLHPVRVLPEVGHAGNVKPGTPSGKPLRCTFSRGTAGPQGHGAGETGNPAVALAAGIALVYLRSGLTVPLLGAGVFFVLFYTWPLKYVGLCELALLLVLLALPKFVQVAKIYARPKPAEPPADHPRSGRPLWFASWAFVHDRAIGGLFLLGHIPDVVLQGLVL